MILKITKQGCIFKVDVAYSRTLKMEISEILKMLKHMSRNLMI